MSLRDPHTMGLLNRSAQKLGGHGARLDQYERRGGGSGGTSGGGGVTFADTGNIVFANVSGNVTADIPTTAEPELAKLGIGIAPTDFLDMVSSGTDRALNSVHSIATTDVVTAGYRPWRFVMNNKTTDSGSGASIGLSVANYFGGSTSSVAAHGTTHAATFDTIIMGSDSVANEQASVYMSLLDKTSDLAGSQPGTLWLTDTKVVGVLPTYAAGGATPQQTILSGHNLLINKYQAASPVLSDAVGVVISTRPVSASTIGTPQGSQSTVPVDVGLAITGVSGAFSPIGTGIGFTTAIRVGGNRTPWFPGSAPVAYGESHIGTGIEVADFDTEGIRIHRRWAGSTGKALSLGFDTAGTASTSFRDGINFGDDVHLYRGATNTLAIDGSLSVAGELLDAHLGRVSAGGLTLGMTSQTAGWGVSATEHGVFADATIAPFTVTAPGSTTTGQTMTVIKTDASANAVTISGSGQTFDGASTKVLTSQYDSATMIFDGVTAWYSIGGGGGASGSAGGHLTGTYPDPTFLTTATPQLARLGLGVAAGTGRITFPAGTTTADGIGFGTDVEIYRSAADRLAITGDTTIPANKLFVSDGSQTFPIAGFIGDDQPRVASINKNGSRTLFCHHTFDNSFIPQLNLGTNRASDFGIFYKCTATHASDSTQEAQGTTGRYSSLYVGDSTELNAGGVNKYHYPGTNNYPAIGTVHTETRNLILQNLGDRLGETYDNEQTMARWVYADETTPASVTAGGVHGRGWFCDWTMNGPADNSTSGSHVPEQFFGISMGLTYYNSNSPTDTPSAGMYIHTSHNVPKAGTIHVESQTTIGTQPLDYGLCIRGYAGTPAAQTRLGFRTGICVGGTNMPFNQSSPSLIGQGIELLDWSTGGLKIWKRTAGSGGHAITLGYDTTGAPSTSYTDGITFGEDVTLYRSGTTQIACSGSFTVSAGVLNAAAARVTMGGVSGPVTARTTGYTVAVTERNITGDTTSAAFTINLPASPLTGQEYRITRINAGANNLTVSGNGKNIDAGTDLVLNNQYAGCFLYYDGTRWVTVSQRRLDIVVGAATALGGAATGMYLSNGGQMDTVNGAGAWLRNYAAPGDANAAAQILFSGEYRMGAGGASAPDIGFVRAAANILKITDGTTSGGAGFRAGRIGLAIDPDVSIAKVIFPSTNAVADGISFGVDANRVTLYRSANDMLATDDSMHIATALGIGQAANATKLSFPASTATTGGIDFGGDTTLYRSAADTLKTDDNFNIGGALLNASTTRISAAGMSGGVTAQTANYTVTALVRKVTMDATGGARTVTLTTAPVSGQEVTVTKIDSSANAVTVVRGGALALEGGTQIVLATQWQSCDLYYDGTRWVVKSSDVAVT